MGGRGAGKTRAGAEWIRRAAGFSQAPVRIALVAETYGDAREIMIEGQSGLRAITLKSERPAYETSRRRLVWPNGAIAYCFSAEDPDGLRGFQFDVAWSDELCKWRYPEQTWSNLQLALRLGENPQQVVTTTPKPMPLLKRLLQAETTVTSRATSYDNRDNLAGSFLTEIVRQYEGTRLGRQELMGDIVEEAEGALWTWRMIEASRISGLPTLDRIVVAVDPPASSGPDADACGIIIAGCAMVGKHMNGFVIADRSAPRLSPQDWGERVIAAYHQYEANFVLVESNQGGEMARHVLQQIDKSVPVKMAFAGKAKRARAEPVALLYQQNRVRHLGQFPELEDEMTSFTGHRVGEKSPDRLDALVWALTEIVVNAQKDPTIRSL